MDTLAPTYEALQKKLGIANPHAVPRFTKVVVNVGVGKNRDNKQYLEAVRRDLAAITGQAPHHRLARKAIAGFNVRENNLVGYRVTLRGARMEDFIRRFINITLPRVRDFRGIPTTSFDGQGNLNVGLREHMPFPEIQPEKTDVIFGVQVTFVTTTPSDAAAKELFLALGFPFQALSDTQGEAGAEGLTAAEAAREQKEKA